MNEFAKSGVFMGGAAALVVVHRFLGKPVE